MTLDAAFRLLALCDCTVLSLAQIAPTNWSIHIANCEGGFHVARGDTPEAAIHAALHTSEFHVAPPPSVDLSFMDDFFAATNNHKSTTPKLQLRLK